MAELKTQKTKASVSAFLNRVPEPQKRKDAQEISKIMKTVTGEKPAMWGSSIVGFGTYHYESQRSAQKGDWPIVGFSPRKQNLTIYIMPGFKEYRGLLKKLGPHKTGGSCLYLKRLSDVDTRVLKTIIKKSVAYMQKKYKTNRGK